MQMIKMVKFSDMLKKNPNRITTYQDLILAKQEIKQDINFIEEDLRNNNIIKLSTTIIGGKFNKSSIFNSLDLKGILSSPLGKFASTLLLSNKFIRKYFVAFVVVKETVPYALSKIKEIIDVNSSGKDDK